MGQPPKSVVLLLAIGAGLTVASLYYNQPMLAALAADLHTTPARIGLVPTMTQVGYSVGILGFAPLGDKLDRRQVILAKCCALIGALLTAAIAPSAEVVIGVSLLLGILATAAQDLVPAAAAIAPAESRGRIVGTVMTGLLLGILLSRVVSGTVAQYVSWRAVFAGAAALTGGLTLLLAFRLPSFPPTTNESYGQLLFSIVSLIRKIPALRQATLAQAILAFAFSGFWSTLALGLSAPPFGLGPTVAGAFGIAGAAGALAAPIAGGFADKRGPAAVARLGGVVCLVSFGAMAALSKSIVMLVIGTIVFDAGTQSSLIAHQTIVYAQDPNARSRLNAVLVSGMFVGMASGAFTATRVFATHGFFGVLCLCTTASLAAVVVRSL